MIPMSCAVQLALSLAKNTCRRAPLSYSLLETCSIVFRAGALSVIACLRLLHQI